MVSDNGACKVIYRDIKYPRLEFKTGELVLVLPVGHSLQDTLEKSASWIDKKSKFICECLDDIEDRRLVTRTDEEFKILVTFAVDSASKELNANVNKVFFRMMKTKWASCSAMANITINRLMTLLPKYLIEYIIYHEVAHIIEKKHTERFWRIISKRFDEYQGFEKDLFSYWFLVNLFMKEYEQA